jgi:acyl-CoA reductase-like NAD-dependent aldehyde dehydrogenase
MSTDIIMVHKDIAKEFLQALKETVTAMQTESLPLVVSSAAVSRIKTIIDDATKKGGELFHGGLPPSGQKPAQVIPTVIGGLSEDMNLWKEEAFGPLVGYRLISDEEEAVKLANSQGYGLSASVFTRDLRKGLALAKKIESGYVPLKINSKGFANVSSAVHINSMTVNVEVPMPFGGVKNSGWGRFNCKEGMEEFLTTKSVTWDD